MAIRSVWLGNRARNRLDATSPPKLEANAVDVGHVQAMALHGCEQTQLSQVGGESVNSLIAEIFGQAFGQPRNIFWHGSERLIEDLLKNFLDEWNQGSPFSKGLHQIRKPGVILFQFGNTDF